MKRFKQYVDYLLLAANLCCLSALLASAYSPLINPGRHPWAAILGLSFPILLLICVAFALFWLVSNYRYALLSLPFFLFSHTAIRDCLPLNTKESTLPSDSIKILSYNVMSFDWLSKNQQKENEILNYLRDSKADIICLQEYAASNATKSPHLTSTEIKRALKDYPHRHIYEVSRGGNQLACFSRFPIIKTQPIRYESRNNGSVAYRLLVDGDTLNLINNHLESNKLTMEDRGTYEDFLEKPDATKAKTGLRQLLKKFAEAAGIRASQADSVAQYIESIPTHQALIVCGDFNDSPISYVHRVLTKRTKDAFSRTGMGLGISFHRNKFYFRIDHILVGGNLTPHNCVVDRSIARSDHYPVWCFVSRNNKKIE